jgi:RNA polymerase sigma-70 factor (ECF subfamily)
MTFDVERRQRFEAITDEVYEPLQRYLRRRVAHDDAGELLDDVLMTVWRRLPDVPDGAALPWCYGVARRAVANRRRSHRRQMNLVARLAAQPPPPPGSDGTEGHPLLAAALHRLPEADREVLRLWAWEQLEPREIAEVLDSTPNAVSLRLTRAKKKLAVDLRRQDRVDAGHKGFENTGEHAS